MNNTKLILAVSTGLSLMVIIPRIILLIGGWDSEAISFLRVTFLDTVFRFLSLFVFCFIILKLNIDWSFKWFSTKPFVKSSLLSGAILLLWMVLFRILNVDIIVSSSDPSTLNPRFNEFVYVMVMLTLLVISRAIVLNNQSKIDAIEKARLKQQSLQNELSALRNQVNPHFLFNSLNSLSLLVRQDQKAAGKFINQLSFLYRYILQSKDQDMVTLKEELKFLESYIYLVKHRYHKNFEAQIAIDQSLYSNKIPALALQLLVENAVKHNEISTARPLVVDLYNEGNSLIVKNKLQLRRANVEGTHTGLANLIARFRLHLDEEIEVASDGDYFIVKLPTKYEGTNH